jgi:ribonuclease HII
MNRIHEEFPMYNWKQNKGYPTKEHRDAIRKHGVTKYHRMSFRLLRAIEARHLILSFCPVTISIRL